jgi:hypothetical protein
LNAQGPGGTPPGPAPTPTTAKQPEVIDRVTRGGDRKPARRTEKLFDAFADSYMPSAAVAVYLRLLYTTYVPLPTSMQALARMCRLPRPTLIKALRELQLHGWLSVEPGPRPFTIRLRLFFGTSCDCVPEGKRDAKRQSKHRAQGAER